MWGHVGEHIGDVIVSISTPIYSTADEIAEKDVGPMAATSILTVSCPGISSYSHISISVCRLSVTLLGFYLYYSAKTIIQDTYQY